MVDIAINDMKSDFSSNLLNSDFELDGIERAEVRWSRGGKDLSRDVI
jgi:hypothetical protein